MQSLVLLSALYRSRQNFALSHRTTCPHTATKVRETFRQVLNSETVGHKDRRPGQIVYILVFYNISFSWLLPLDDFQFICLLPDCWRLSNTVICICGLTCHVSRRLFWAIEMFTKDQNHRTLFREAECKRILLQFALGYLKPISLRRLQRPGARRNGCFFCQSMALDWI